MKGFWPRLLLTYLIVFFSLMSVPVFPVHTKRDKSYIEGDSVDIIVGSAYSVEDSLNQRRSYDQKENSIESNGFGEDIFVRKERERCWNNDGAFTSCWKYLIVKLIQDSSQFSGIPSIEEYLIGSNSSEVNKSYLVRLSVYNETASIGILGRADESKSDEFLEFLERQLAKFISRHGVLFHLSQLSAGENDILYHAEDEDEENPVGDTGDVKEEGRQSRHKVKKKSILFPLLVLFKFFKIKMILVPILLSVLFIKKLLILILVLAPNLLGLFRQCRPGFGPPWTPPFGLTAAGLLQEVSDNRGEFSTLYNTYNHPYRDSHGYRTRDLGMPPSKYMDQETDDSNDNPFENRYRLGSD